jgi:hypothetical protein
VSSTDTAVNKGKARRPIPTRAQMQQRVAKSQTSRGELTDFETDDEAPAAAPPPAPPPEKAPPTGKKPAKK